MEGEITRTATTTSSQGRTQLKSYLCQVNKLRLGQRDGFKIDEDDNHKLHFYDVFSIHLGMNRATRCLRAARISVSSEVSIYICR